jgi:hypothetical protein
MALSLEIIEWGDTAACMTFVRGVVASALPPQVFFADGRPGCLKR